MTSLRRHNILAGSNSNKPEDESEAPLNDYESLNPKGAKLKLWEDDGFLDQYLDDSLISSEHEDETPDPTNPLKMIPGYRQHVLQFLRVWSAENLPLQAKKCHFFCKYIRHLGIVCGQGTLMCDPDKVAAAVHIERPVTKSKLRKFLGAVGWFRMWIANFAKLQGPMNSLLKGKDPDNQKFKTGQWTEEHEEASKRHTALRARQCANTATLSTRAHPFTHCTQPP